MLAESRAFGLVVFIKNTFCFLVSLYICHEDVYQPVSRRPRRTEPCQTCPDKRSTCCHLLRDEMPPRGVRESSAPHVTFPP
ncbi:hypothetical protein EDD17DRAFT_1597755 [Pisolithus thermaeus]|nr:hypothetical protein EDD17DRAFT_1597755 [Pisolithus thermaeus]